MEDPTVLTAEQAIERIVEIREKIPPAIDLRFIGDPDSFHLEQPTISTEVFITGFRSDPTTAVVLYEPVESEESAFPFNLHRCEEDAEPSGYAAAIKGHFTYRGKVFDQLIFFQCQQSPGLFWEKFTRAGVKGVALANIDPHHDWTEPEQVLRAAKTETKASPRMVSVSDPELVDIFNCPTVPAEAKILTALVSSYPFVVDELVKYGDLVFKNEFAKAYGVTFGDGARLTRVELDKQAKSAIAAAILLPAYSDENHIAKQIHKRVKAACTTYGAQYPDEADIAQGINHVAKSNQHLPNTVTGMMACLVARDHDLKFNLGVTTVEMADIGDLRNIGYKDGFATQLFTQAQMVYDGFHKSTINFVLEVATIINNHKVLLGGPAEVEMKNVQTMRQLVEGRPFVAMTPTQVTSLRVSQFPHMAYLALQYRLRSLSDPQEKQRFEKYNFEGVAAHLAGSNEQALLLARVKAIPTPLLADILDQVKHATAAQVDSFLSFSTEVTKDQLYLQCIQTGTKGAWFDREHKKIQLAIRVRYQAKYTQLALEMLQEEVNSIRGAIFTEVPLEKQGLKMQEVTLMEEALKREIRGSTTVKDLLMSGSDDQSDEELAKFEKSYSRLVKLMAQARNEILSTNSGTRRHDDSEDEEDED